MSAAASRGWRRGDLAVEDAGAEVHLRHRRLPAGIAAPVTLGKSSLLFEVVEYLAAPRSDGEILQRFAGSDIVSAVRELSLRGLAFRSAAAEEAYLARRRALHVLRASEAAVGDVMGFGTALFEGERAPLGGEIAAALEQVDRLLADIDRRLAAARQPYVDEQCARLGVAEQFGALQLNLGSGRRRLPGWIGIDLQDSDLRLNLRRGLPFADRAARHVYSAHFIEHLHPEDAKVLLAEIRRVLCAGGVVRLVVPDIALLIAAYSRGDEAFFVRRGELWPETALGGTMLQRFLPYAGAGAPIGEPGAHKFGYDFATLAGLLQSAGFRDIERSAYNASAHPALRIDDTSAAAALAIDGVHCSLFVEARA